MRDVVYIFERVGSHGGPLWLLVLECGHTAWRSRHDPRFHQFISAMFQPLSKKLAPKRCRCLHCGMGSDHRDPAEMIRMHGGEV